MSPFTAKAPESGEVKIQLFKDSTGARSKSVVIEKLPSINLSEPMQSNDQVYPQIIDGVVTIRDDRHSINSHKIEKQISFKR